VAIATGRRGATPWLVDRREPPYTVGAKMQSRKQNAASKDTACFAIRSGLAETIC
jgi:hypothetical protein